jgi:DNA-binding PadR family transcriptional regulator
MMHRKRGLRMIIVRMLANGPRNGAELMDDIEKMTQGWWRPTPGAIYPVLKQLSDEGVIRKMDDGKYELTEKAHEELEWSFGPSYAKPRSLDSMMSEISGFVSYVEEVRKSDAAKVEPYLAEIQELSRRLSRLSEKS